jgi:hypothetical protein
MAGSAGLRYIVVMRESKVPMSRHATLEAAADKIYRDRAFARWKVMAQEGLEASAPMRSLTKQEMKRVERRLFPSLFE